LNGIRVAKYVVRATYLLLWALILVIVAGPIAGVVSPALGKQTTVGLGVDLQSIQPQVQQVFSSGSDIGGTHAISVPAFNNWPLPGDANLSLTIIDAGQVVYRTQPTTLHLAPFQSGELNISMVLSPSVVAQIQGQSVDIGGTMSLSEGQFWTITVSFPQQ
jgi:hypothetical protein